MKTGGSGSLVHLVTVDMNLWVAFDSKKESKRKKERERERDKDE